MELEPQNGSIELNKNEGQHVFEVSYSSSSSHSSEDDIVFDSLKLPQSKTNQQQTEIPGYDVNRIPASVFARKPANSLEWSTASNESLFSIHMGNASFSKEHYMMLHKSGEIPKWDEQIGGPIMSGLPVNSNQMDFPAEANDPSSSPAVSHNNIPSLVSHSDGNSNSTQSSPVVSRSNIPTLASCSDENIDSPKPFPAMNHDIPSQASHSDGSNNSTKLSPAVTHHIPSVASHSDESNNNTKSFPVVTRNIPSLASRSDSNNSTSSFAFHVLASDERTISPKAKMGMEAQESLPAKMSMETQESLPTKMEMEKPPSMQQQSLQAPAPAPAPQTTQAGCFGWFSCVCCCPFPFRCCCQ